jgi:DNA-directed RNA polymerase specialized sigma24 family protein
LRVQWRALRESLVRLVRTLAAHTQFGELRQRAAVLLRFDDPLGLIDYLTQRGGDLDEKDRIYATLVEAAQARESGSSLAATLLLLGLWPGLDAIYRRRLGRFSNDPGELVALIAGQFTAAVHRLRLHRVRRVAATMVWNTSRLVVYEAEKREKEDAKREELPNDDVLADLRGAISDVSLEEERIETLRRSLASTVGEWDAALLIATEVEGESQRAFALRLGLSEGMVRKRHQRALTKLKSKCPTSGAEGAFTWRRARLPPGDDS